MSLGLQERADEIRFRKELRKLSVFHKELFYTIVKNRDRFIVHVRECGTIFGLPQFCVLIRKNIVWSADYID